ncbi:hypothetical protein MHU86_8330 [Fragilaria crotonensis]|nr:hypothetical protein MHU86_8330 [Fragilaria crotonensis]
MRRMRRTLHDGARHVLSQRRADPPPPQRPRGDMGTALRTGAHPPQSLTPLIQRVRTCRRQAPTAPNHPRTPRRHRCPRVLDPRHHGDLRCPRHRHGRPSNRNTPEKVLLRHEREEGQIRRALHCATPYLHPSRVSVDGMQGVEATAASRRLASSLASKWKRSYSEVCGFVRSRLAIALVRSASRCLRADRNPMRRTPSPIWDCGAGLGLYRM